MKIIACVVLFLTLLVVTSCKKDDNPLIQSSTATNKVTVGTWTDAAGQIIPPSGGTITINRTGDPLNGFQLIVPQNGFAQSQDLTISYAEIKSHQLGSTITPAAPLIKITSNGGYASNLIRIKIPIKLPAGYFALGFFVDEATGDLEALPIESLDSASITIATRHLSPSNEHASAKLSKGSSYAWGTLLVSMITDPLLFSTPDIASGFTLGIDDWEFPNFGSIIAPGGHCAGQSITSIWYFLEKRKKGNPSLYHQLDQVCLPATPGVLWADNPRGYRFASTIQMDANFDNWVRGLNFQSVYPILTWRAFIYAMLASGKPQLVLVRNSATGAGHAMVVYGISPTSRKLLVADPNYPNNRDPRTGAFTFRTIDFGTLYFYPYSSSLSAADANRIDFDQIGFAGNSAHVDWAQVEHRWNEVLNGTIGNDRFPTYTLLVRDGAGGTFVDGMDTYRDSIHLACLNTAVTHSIGGTGLQQLDAYDLNGNLLGSATSNNGGILALKLQPGYTRIGFHIMAADTHHYNHYVDFKWQTVHKLVTLRLSTKESNGAPLTVAGTTGKLYTFVASSGGLMPKNGKGNFLWDFGDGTSPVKVMNDSTTIHAFSKDGNFSIGSRLYDDTVMLGDGYATASIAPAATGIKEVTVRAGYLDYWMSCDTTRRMSVDWYYRNSSGTYVGRVYTTTWVDTFRVGSDTDYSYNSVRVYLNTSATAIDSFRTHELQKFHDGFERTYDLLGKNVPLTNGAESMGWMEFNIVGSQMCSNLTMWMRERYPGVGCDSRLYRYSCQAGARLIVVLR